MARYIDIEGAGIGKANREQFLVPEFADGWNAVLKILEKEPTADVVEVVRCEKCKYFREYSDAHKRAVERADGDCYLKLTHSCDEQFIACRYNDFCSYGERKDKEC